MVSRFTDDAAHLAGGGRIDPAQVTEVEETLTTAATVQAPDFIRRLGVRILGNLDPDGQEPTHGELIAKQGIIFHQPRRGLIHFDGHMTVPQYEHVMTSIGSATNPRPYTDFNDINPAPKTGTGTCTEGRENLVSGPNSDAEVPDQVLITMASLLTDTRTTAPEATEAGTSPVAGSASVMGDSDTAGCDSATAEAGPLGASTDKSWPRIIDGIRIPAPGSWEELPGLDSIHPDSIDPANTDKAMADERTRAQKLLDGLIDCLALAARTNTLPDNGGLRPQLFLTLNQNDLEHGTGTALAHYTGPVPVTAFHEIYCDAEIIGIIKNAEGQIMNVKRAQRLVPPEMRKIPLARDHGCTFPGCTRPGHWTEAHHIIPWLDGGETSVLNCCLLCTYHHHLLHRTDWTITMIHGTPYYTPPYHLDPGQKPRRNTYHHATNPDSTPAPTSRRN